MKVLFLESSQAWINGLPNGFKDLGNDVRISGELTEDSLSKILSEFKPDLVVTMAISNEIKPIKIGLINKYIRHLKIPIIYWATEDPAYTYSITLPIIKRLRPDFIFTICKRRIDYYKKLGFKVGHLEFGYHESIHKKVDICEEYKTSIVVVANAYYEFIKENPNCFREHSLNTLIVPLLKNNIRVDFWGRDWERMSEILDFSIPKEYIHGYLPYIEANKVYSSADIVIGLQNKQVTQRTYEILGSGGFLITNNTPEIMARFKNKEGLIISSSAEETLDAVKYYLHNSDERKKIRELAQKVVKQYSYKNRAIHAIEILKKEGMLSNELN